MKQDIQKWRATQRRAVLKQLAKRRTKKRHTRIRRRKAGPLTYWKNKAIDEAKRVARSIGYCEKCGSTKNLQGSHIIAVGESQLIAADPDNILCLCWSCHLGNGGWHLAPSSSIDWFDTRWPGRRKALRERADRLRDDGFKPTAEHWKAVYDSLKAQNRH